MLNELLLIERGAPKVEVDSQLRHPDIQEVAQGIKTARVWINTNGAIAKVMPIPKGVRLWTLRNHNKNSFPLIQVRPILDDSAVARWKAWKEHNPQATEQAIRQELGRQARAADLRRKKLGEWASATVMEKLAERLSQIKTLAHRAKALSAALERFLRIADTRHGGDPLKFLDSVRRSLIQGLRRSPSSDWILCATALLLEGKGAIYIDAEGDWPCSLIDRAILPPISVALDGAAGDGDTPRGRCALTGTDTLLVPDTFPRIDLPIIGPTILFARFHGRPANQRYDRFGRDSMPVGQATGRRLAATLRTLTDPSRENTTWRSIPGERPKQTDLLLAYVEGALDAAVADVVSDDELSSDVPAAALFKRRAERLIEATRGHVNVDLTRTPVRLAVIRKLDPANRKVVYSGELPVTELYRAALSWANGETNVPPWLSVPVFEKGAATPVRLSHLHVAPLGMIAFSKQVFIRGGLERQEAVGLPASEAMALFIENDRPRALRALRLVLTRRAALVSSTAHALHRGIEHAKGFDRREALRTSTVVAVLLYKLTREKEAYMIDAAFQLGQLLATADVLHAGYCADVRGGDLPPALLGNQVFAMAQTAPSKALAVLSRRWKPYGGWAKKNAGYNRPGRFCDQTGAWKKWSEIKGSDERKDYGKARAIESGVWAARRCSELAGALHGRLELQPDDVFRAELLLGYLAGTRPAQRPQAHDDVGNGEPEHDQSNKEQTNG